MALQATTSGEDADLPSGDCLQCPKRSAWTLRAVPGPTAASSTEFRWPFGSPKVMKIGKRGRMFGGEGW